MKRNKIIRLVSTLLFMSSIALAGRVQFSINIEGARRCDRPYVVYTPPPHPMYTPTAVYYYVPEYGPYPIQYIYVPPPPRYNHMYQRPRCRY